MKSFDPFLDSNHVDRDRGKVARKDSFGRGSNQLSLVQ